jgi:hypothetical protein
MTATLADFELGAGRHRVVIRTAGVKATRPPTRSISLHLQLRGAGGFARVNLMLSHPAAHGVVLRDLRLVAALLDLVKPSGPIYDETDLAAALSDTDVAWVADLAADPVAGLRLISVGADV